MVCATYPDVETASDWLPEERRGGPAAGGEEPGSAEGKRRPRAPGQGWAGGEAGPAGWGVPDSAGGVSLSVGVGLRHQGRAAGAF